MYELIYRSTASKGLKATDIQDILKKSEKFNAQHNLTGCLLYHKDEFLQIIEGEEKDVKELFEHIKKDKRHTDVMVLEEGFTNQRLFTNWSMAYQPLESNLVNKINRELFASNFNTLSKIIEKPTNAVKLFFYMSKELLDEEE